VRVYAPPPAPAITGPANALQTFTASGTGIAGDTISIFEGATLVGSTVVDSDGTWDTQLTLSIGTHTLTAKQTDPVSGGTSTTSSSSTVGVYAPPPAPVITSVSTPAATKTTSPVTVSGTGVAGETITLYDGGDSIKTVVVASNGTWSTTVNLAVG